nr:MAG: hypothetical protein [Cressdnaviricota sp.]
MRVYIVCIAGQGTKCLVILWDGTLVLPEIIHLPVPSFAFIIVGLQEIYIIFVYSQPGSICLPGRPYGSDGRVDIRTPNPNTTPQPTLTLTLPPTLTLPLK